MTLKDALFRELKYGLCGSGGVLDGIIAQDHVRMDARSFPSSERDADDYPWLVFRVSKNEEVDQVNFTMATVEMAVIGLRSSATKGDDLLESIRTTLIDAFAGRRKTWGKYTSSGAADPSGGLKMSASYLDTVEALDDKLYEKHYIMMFRFAYVRG